MILRLSRTRHFIIISFCRFYLSIQTALSCLKGAFSLFSFCVYNPTFKVVEKVFRFSKSKVCCSRFLEKTAFFPKREDNARFFPILFPIYLLRKNFVKSSFWRKAEKWIQILENVIQLHLFLCKSLHENWKSIFHYENLIPNFFNIQHKVFNSLSEKLSVILIYLCFQLWTEQH